MKCRTTKTRPRLLRVPQALRYLDNVVAPGTFRNWICAGRVPVVRLGRTVCVRTDVLDELRAGRGEAVKPEVASA
jgi:hypothetical protein